MEMMLLLDLDRTLNMLIFRLPASKAQRSVSIAQQE